MSFAVISISPVIYLADRHGCGRLCVAVGIDSDCVETLGVLEAVCIFRPPNTKGPVGVCLTNPSRILWPPYENRRKMHAELCGLAGRRHRQQSVAVLVIVNL